MEMDASVAFGDLWQFSRDNWGNSFPVRFSTMQGSSSWLGLGRGIFVFSEWTFFGLKIWKVNFKVGDIPDGGDFKSAPGCYPLSWWCSKGCCVPLHMDNAAHKFLNLHCFCRGTESGWWLRRSWPLPFLVGGKTVSPPTFNWLVILNKTMTAKQDCW